MIVQSATLQAVLRGCFYACLILFAVLFVIRPFNVPLWVDLLFFCACGTLLIVGRLAGRKPNQADESAATHKAKCGRDRF